MARPSLLSANAAPALVLLLVVGGLVGCAERKPDRLALDPSGPLRFDKKGASEELKVAAYTGHKPYVQAVPALWSSSDPSVATVDETGKVTATGSGTASITASAWGIATAAEVKSVIVGSVEVKDDVPRPLRLSAKPWPLQVTVKDDKGNVIDNPLVRYRATNYCVEVDDNGVLSPLADGECDVVIEAADQQTRIKLQIKG